MKTTAAVTLAVVALGAASMSPAIGAPKKTTTKTYSVTAAVPDPTNVAGGYTVCPQRVPGSFQADEFKVPAAGTLAVELSGYNGDWDALLMDSDKSELASSGSGGYPPVAGGPESMELRFKKAQTVTIVACNFSGGPTGSVKVTFTYK
ncbi:MAG: hypothetical protein QOI82_1710 [Actinomycetota bacterium]|jgi:hypothetical protein|nr:hypothetical protein [Actinomycetota bacterium]